MRFEVGGDYDIDVDGFWSSVFFEPEFNDFLYGAGLLFQGYEITEERVESDGARYRVLKAYPNTPIPKTFQKFLGQKVYYIETGRYDPKAKVWNTQIDLPRLGSKLKLNISMSFKPAGPGRSVRRVTFDLGVKVFGIGRVIERFIESTLVENYDSARVVTNEWIRDNLTQDG